MELWAILGGLCVLFVFGVVMYRAGKKIADYKAYKTTVLEYEKVAKIIKNTNGLGRAVLLKRLRDLAAKDKK